MEDEKIVSPEPVMDLDENGSYQKLSEKYDVIFKCMSCNSEIFMDNYCSVCGKRLR